MKRSATSIALTLALTLVSVPVFAQYTGPQANIMTTVEKVKTLRDDTYVSLQGKIVQALGAEKYLFRDETGDIVIEIDHDKWMGVSVGENDTVTIYGEVDKDWNSVEIDVKRVTK